MQIVVANHAVEATQNIVVDASCSNSRSEGTIVASVAQAAAYMPSGKTVGQREVPRCGRRARARSSAPTSSGIHAVATSQHIVTVATLNWAKNTTLTFSRAKKVGSREEFDWVQIIVTGYFGLNCHWVGGREIRMGLWLSH
jgi:hypothetical protein